MADPAKRAATYEDLCKLPSNQVGQLVFGVLHAHPRPAPRHARASSVLGSDLGSPFDRGRGGPGGWLILFEPELHLGDHVLVPDLAGWRRERMPELPVDEAFFRLAPDWVCEVLSPGTVVLDRGDKRAVYAAQGVTHVWFVDPIAQTLEALELDGETYRIREVHSGDATVRVAPFDAIELELAAVWSR